nr:MAG TPA: hypothetical protein [Caudoviricetes sp.]
MYFLIVHVRVHGYLAKTFFKKRLFWFDSRNSLQSLMRLFILSERW